MSLHQVAELKAGVQGILQNISLNKITNLNGALERAARIICQQADVPEASGVQPITLYDGVDYYLAPETIFGGAINLIRRQGQASSPLDYNYKVPIEQFTRTKQFLPNGYMMDVEYKNGVAMLGISSPIPFPKIIVDPMSDTTGWGASGTASGLTQDATNYYQQPGSLRFLLGTGVGTLTKTLTTPLQISNYENVGVAFLAIEIPEGTTASTLTGVSLQLGSSAVNYDQVSETEGFLGAWISGTWLLVALDFAGAISTGTPNWNAINRVVVNLTASAPIVNMRTGYLFMALPSPNEILFQSSAIFLGANGIPTQTVTSDGDTIVLNDAAYQLYEFESALQVAIQQGGDLASGEVQMLRGMLYGAGNDIGLYALHKADNPSSELRTVGSWYNPW